MQIEKKMPVFELFVDFFFSISSVKQLNSCALEKFSHFGCGFLLETRTEVDY